MYYIGVDLGGTSIKVGILNSEYEIIQSATLPTRRERAAEEILEDMAMVCKEVMSEAGITEKEIHSIGIGCPGIASPKEGVVIYSSNLNFRNVNVKKEIQKYIDSDVFVENDANAATLGEAICGAAKGKGSVVMVTLGTGIGGGIILNGKIFGGAYFGGGEIGHHVIALENGIPCGCGRTGCWEQYASATALIRQAKQVATQNPNSALVTLAKGNAINNITAKTVFDAADQGDAVAEEVLDQYFKYIAQGVANIVNILQPEAIVIGGGVSAQKGKLTEPVRKYVQDEMYGGLELQTEIKAATLGNDAGIIGAALIGTRL
ncbi:MAG: ROK family protein [Cellulosilyticaceae bacterium]